MKKMSLKTKLFLMTLSLVVLSMIQGGIGQYGSLKTKESYLKIVDNYSPKLLLSESISKTMLQNSIFAEEMVSKMTEESERPGRVIALKQSMESYKQLSEKYHKIEALEGEEELTDKFFKHFDKINLVYEDYLKQYESLKNQAGGMEKLEGHLVENILPMYMQGNSDIEKLSNFLIEKETQSVKSAAEEYSATAFVVLALSIIVGFSSLIFSYFFTSSLTKTLGKITESLDKSSDELSAASTQIAASSQNLSQSTTEQAASLEETSASVEEMSSMIAISAENAKKASEISSQSQKEAYRGKQSVDDMSQMMGMINDNNTKIMMQMNTAASQMNDIVNVIKEIEQKTRVINDIVFQTKLLSFNASVEAARAGEQGKGFAVVAEEVGNLAAMSGQAATEISAMLSQSVVKVESIVNGVTSNVNGLVVEGKERLEKGTNVVNDCQKILDHIVMNVNEVARMSHEISTANSEQAKGIQEITKAMGQLDQVTHTNSAATQQTSAAADSLASQSVELKHQVHDLVQLITGIDTDLENKPKKETSKKNSIDHKKDELKKPVTKKRVEVKEEKNNVISIKKSASKEVVKDVRPTAITVSKIASNGAAAKESVPDYDHPGFEEI